MSKRKTSDFSGITVLPDSDNLKADVERLRTELSMLVLERDELLYQECKNIEMAYLLALGGLEFKVYEIECAILRLKRKAELIQAKKNRQEKVSLAAIEKILNKEFAEYQAKLDAQIDRMNAALERSHRGVLSDEEAAEIKKLYRAIVKALHPDLHPEQSASRIQLFCHAVEAYENGDLNEIRIISVMTAEPSPAEENTDRTVFLLKEKERLTKLVKDVQDRIAEVKAEYPYTMKSLVQNPERIRARKAELEEEIRKLNEVLAMYTEKITVMLKRK